MKFISSLSYYIIPALPFAIKNKSVRLKWFWTVCGLVFFLGMVVHLYFVIAQFIKMKTRTLTTIDHTEAPFPAVTICSLNPYSKDIVNGVAGARDLVRFKNMKAYAFLLNQIQNEAGTELRLREKHAATIVPAVKAVQMERLTFREVQRRKNYGDAQAAATPAATTACDPKLSTYNKICNFCIETFMKSYDKQIQNGYFYKDLEAAMQKNVKDCLTSETLKQKVFEESQKTGVVENIQLKKLGRAVEADAAETNDEAAFMIIATAKPFKPFKAQGATVENNLTSLVDTTPTAIAFSPGKVTSGNPTTASVVTEHCDCMSWGWNLIKNKYLLQTTTQSPVKQCCQCSSSNTQNTQVKSKLAALPVATTTCDPKSSEYNRICNFCTERIRFAVCDKHDYATLYNIQDAIKECMIYEANQLAQDAEAMQKEARGIYDAYLKKAAEKQEETNLLWAAGNLTDYEYKVSFEIQQKERNAALKVYEETSKTANTLESAAEEILASLASNKFQTKSVYCDCKQWGLEVLKESCLQMPKTITQSPVEQCCQCSSSDTITTDASVSLVQNTQNVPNIQCPGPSNLTSIVLDQYSNLMNVLSNIHSSTNPLQENTDVAEIQISTLIETVTTEFEEWITIVKELISDQAQDIFTELNAMDATTSTSSSTSTSTSSMEPSHSTTDAATTLAGTASTSAGIDINDLSPEVAEIVHYVYTLGISTTDRLNIVFKERLQEIVTSMDFANRNRTFDYYTPKLRDVVQACAINTQPCDLERDFIRYTDPEYGLCYTFNGMPRSHNYKSINHGETHGLQILLMENVSNYLPTSTKEGSRITIHSPYTEPSPSAHGMNIPIGKVTRFSLKYEESHYMGEPYDLCIEVDTTTFQNYTVDSCMETCHYEYIVKRCQCTDYRFDSQNPDLKICNSLNASQAECKQEAMANFLAEMNSICSCPKECKFPKYHAQLTHLGFEAKEENLHHEICSLAEHSKMYKTCSDFVKNNFAFLNVFLTSSSYAVHEERPLFTVLDLVSDLGGVIGLWMGFSIITLVHIHLSCFNMLRVLCFPKFCALGQEETKEYTDDQNNLNYYYQDSDEILCTVTVVS